MKKLLVICLFSVMLSGCEKPQQTLDGSNVESLRISIVEMRNSLPLDEQSRFDEAIELAILNDINFNDLVIAGRHENADIITRKMCQSLDGKTVKEIFLQAEEIRVQKLAFK
ncbi:hypothetical protein I5E97_00325 [Proteus hauseri]|uniref:Lipoprotein n=1 Tax=Proteus cibi TaxID=2050966 RepID=A0ABU6E8P3_9GAMM|nr:MULTISPECIES: DUF6694 family lipoprotein [Proteus]EST58084.1 lipoprotein [Proteus hauseri ZMd44]MBG6029502.1 hypothetical protein [Proteus hauseri]MBS6209762.1 hypothetical protein [Proteus hauseri]MEB6855442.1 hypothetical protein [Proteus cibi]MEB7088565.1 hypothetical protein [Proteus cibi]